MALITAQFFNEQMNKHAPKLIMAYNKLKTYNKLTYNLQHKYLILTGKY